MPGENVAVAYRLEALHIHRLHVAVVKPYIVGRLWLAAALAACRSLDEPEHFEAFPDDPAEVVGAAGSTPRAILEDLSRQRRSRWNQLALERSGMSVKPNQYKLAKIWLTHAIAYLDEILALGLCNQWLKLWGRESVNKSSLRDDEEKNLSSGKDRQLISLNMDMSVIQKARC